MGLEFPTVRSCYIGNVGSLSKTAWCQNKLVQYSRHCVRPVIRSSFKCMVRSSWRARFAHVMGSFAFVALGLQFGWKGSGGRWCEVANAVKAASRETMRAPAVLSQARVHATELIKAVPKTPGAAVVPLPEGCKIPRLNERRRGGGRHGRGSLLVDGCSYVGGVVWWHKEKH